MDRRLQTLGAPGEKQVAFGALDLSGGFLFAAVGSGSGLIAKNQEGMWIPVALRAPARLRRLFLQSNEDWMIAHAPEPITRIPAIGFDAVRNGMPGASFARGNILRDLVASIPMASHE